MKRHIDMDPQGQWENQAIRELHSETLKCPFCGTKLRESSALNEWYCPNISRLCPMRGPLPKMVWQALIDGKKARDALKYALGVLYRVNPIVCIYMEIIKIKEMAGITTQEYKR